MTKWFCDVCKTEMLPGETERIRREALYPCPAGSTHNGKPKMLKVAIEVIHSFQDTCNAGHICHKCLIKTIVDGRQTADGVVTRSRESTFTRE